VTDSVHNRKLQLLFGHVFRMSGNRQQKTLMLRTVEGQPGRRAQK